MSSAKLIQSGLRAPLPSTLKLYWWKVIVTQGHFNHHVCNLLECFLTNIRGYSLLPLCITTTMGDITKFSGILPRRIIQADWTKCDRAYRYNLWLSYISYEYLKSMSKRIIINYLKDPNEEAFSCDFRKVIPHLDMMHCIKNVNKTKFSTFWKYYVNIY